jgi:hypothetical protein
MGFSSFVGSLLSGAGPQSGPYRPPQWSAGPQLWSVTATLPNQSGSSSDLSSSSNTSPGSPTTFFFDAVLRVDHNEEVVITHHPVQSGAALTDHAYSLPAQVTLEVGFSDAMDSFQSGQYSGGSSKSVTAYQQFQQIKDLHLPCTLATRLAQYSNMMLVQLRAPESRENFASTVMTLRFEQIFLGSVSASTQSSRNQQTGSSPEGSLSTTTPGSGTDGLQNGDGTYNSNSLPTF